MKHLIKKIISGGQTGVDQGALEAALSLNISLGGFCPNGRICENGIIPDKFQLIETESKDYSDRTEKNIINSDATLILTTKNKLSGGTYLTKILTNRHKKPCLILNLKEEMDKKAFSEWINNNKVKILNIAGPRESKEKGIYAKTIIYLKELLKDM